MIHCLHLMSDNKCRVASQVAECKVLASRRLVKRASKTPNPQAVNVVRLGMAIVYRKRLGKPIAELRQSVVLSKGIPASAVESTNDFGRAKAS